MDKTTAGKYYTYALFRDDGRIFYIGKGKGYRWSCHAQGARAGERGPRFDIIRDMQARGVEMPKMRIHEGLTEAVAHEYEIALIKAIGRHPYGPLVNRTDGGDGTSGYIPLQEQRARISAALLGHAISAETRARISAALCGKPRPADYEISLETRAKLSAGNSGKVRTLEMRARASVTHLGKKQSPETIAKRSAALTGREVLAETRAKISVANRANSDTRCKPPSPETRAKLSAALLGIPKSPETRAKMSATRLGHKVSPEQTAKQWATRRANQERRRAEAEKIAA